MNGTTIAATFNSVD